MCGSLLDFTHQEDLPGNRGSGLNRSKPNKNFTNEANYIFPIDREVRSTFFIARGPGLTGTVRYETAPVSHPVPAEIPSIVIRISASYDHASMLGQIQLCQLEKSDGSQGLRLLVSPFGSLFAERPLNAAYDDRRRLMTCQSFTWTPQTSG